MKTGAELTSIVGRHGEDSGSSYRGRGRHQDEGGNTSISGNGSGATVAGGRSGPDGLRATFEPAVGIEERVHAPGAVGWSAIQVQGDTPSSTKSMDGGGVEEGLQFRNRGEGPLRLE